MIKKISHISIYVINQSEAYDFYVNKLGFEVRTDATMDNGFRWLTVGPKDQPDMEIALMEIKAGMMFSEETAQKLKDVLQRGGLGGGVFETSDCKATYEELKRQGVEFMSPPQERPYGIEALFKDNSGNWFSLTQHK